MADPHVITGLRAKRDELANHIRDLERRLSKARTDLLYLEHALRIVAEDASEIPVFMRTARLFAKGELQRICLDLLREAPDGLDTRELGAGVIARKGFDPADERLRVAISHSLVDMLGRAKRLGTVTTDAKRRAGGVRVWRIPDVGV